VFKHVDIMMIKDCLKLFFFFNLLCSRKGNSRVITPSYQC